MVDNSLVTDGRDPSNALGAVVFELQLLAAAILLDRSTPRRCGPTTLERYAQRCAAEVMLIKSRSLLELLSKGAERKAARRKTPKDDITMTDLLLDSPKELDSAMEEFRTFVNKRSAHLTWERAGSVIDTWSKRRGESIPARALEVLRLAYGTTVSPLLARGVVPTAARYRRREDVRVLHEQMAQLGLAAFVEEGQM